MFLNSVVAGVCGASLGCVEGDGGSEAGVEEGDVVLRLAVFLTGRSVGDVGVGANNHRVVRCALGGLDEVREGREDGAAQASVVHDTVGFGAKRVEGSVDVQCTNAVEALDAAGLVSLGDVRRLAVGRGVVDDAGRVVTADGGNKQRSVASGAVVVGVIVALEGEGVVEEAQRQRWSGLDTDAHHHRSGKDNDEDRSSCRNDAEIVGSRENLGHWFLFYFIFSIEKMEGEIKK